MNPIPYGRQHIEQEDIDAVVATLRADFLTQGPKVEEFESQFARYVNAQYAVAVSNATAGLHLSVLALGVEPGDRVITTPITFAASANCVRYARGQVWFADIDPDTYLLSLKSTKQLIESKPKGFFKGIIAVDFAGLPVDLEAFRHLADEHGLWIIEDACHAPGGHFNDSKHTVQRCGNGRYADLAVFSFHPVKHIACGEGGMITTNNREHYEKLLLLRSHGITKGSTHQQDGGWFYEMRELGHNYRLTDIQSALGITQLRKNDRGVVQRNAIAERYREAFNGKLKYQKIPDNSYHAYHLFVVEVNNRRTLYDALRKHRIFAQIHYIPIHTFPYYKKVDYSEADLRHAENYYAKCISLPMYPTLTGDEQLRISDLILNELK